jgi:hypothetical protein
MPPYPLYGQEKVTLYDSFTSDFLLLLSKSNIEVGMISPNSRAKTTLETKPPPVWFHIPTEYYTEKAKEYLKRGDVNVALRKSYLPSPESSLSLSNEADIVRASALWFLHPVVKALQAIYPSATCHAEVALVLEGVRCDVLITIDNQVVAVLEYKNRGHLARDQFLQAGLNKYSEPYKANVLAAIQEGRNRQWGSALGHNAMVITKQVAAYAAKYSTRYVALFDWDSLFLWNFAAMTIHGVRQATHGEWAYGTWVEDRAQFRMVLLGFFLKAYAEKRGNPRYNYPARDPWTPSPEESL